VCSHSHIKAIVTAVTSVLAIQVSFTGMECTDCGRRWDMGELMALLYNSDGRLEARPVSVVVEDLE